MYYYKAGDRLKTSEGKFVNLIAEIRHEGWLYFLAVHQGTPDYVAITDGLTLDTQKCQHTGTCVKYDYVSVFRGIANDKEKLIKLISEVQVWTDEAVGNDLDIKLRRVAKLLVHLAKCLPEHHLFSDVLYDELVYEAYDLYAKFLDADLSDEPKEVPQVQLKSQDPQLPIAPLAATITTIEEPKIMSTPTRSKKSQIIDNMKLGAQTGLADEAGNALLQIADKMTDGKVLHHCPTPETQALLKLVTATLLIHGIDLFEADETTKNRVNAACGLVIQAATRDFIQPKMKEIRQATMGLANIGQRSLEAPKTTSDQS